MSLCIDSRYITGIYALGQWFKVKKGTIDVDAYEFTNWEEDVDCVTAPRFNCRHTDYQMGSLYQEPQGSISGRYRDDSPGTWQQPTGSTGISFTCKDTEERISFSLMEVRAFKEKKG